MSSISGTAPGVRAGAGAVGRARKRPGVGTVYRWEMRKLRYQKRTYLGLGAAIVVPILFVVAVHFRHHRNAGGGDFAFASYLTKSGLVFPLVILLFGAIWLFPLITALVAGDIFASEDHNGTLKTVLTRSLERWQIFAGKALTAMTYAIVAIAITGTVAVIAGSIESGFNSVQTLSGTIVSASKGLELVYLSLLVYLIPIATVVCIGLLLSTITRNSAAAVVGTLMISLLFQLIGVLPRVERHPALPAQHPVQRVAGPTASADRLVADRPGGVGVHAVRPAGAGNGVPGVPAPRRRRWLIASWSSTTTRRCVGCSSGRWPPRATRSAWPPMEARRWSRPSGRRPT